MLRLIRKLVYKMGFRPKYGSIFYSPTAAGILMGKDVMKANLEGLQSAIEVMKKAEATGWIELGIVPPIKAITTRRTLYERMLYCLLCRAKLEMLVLDIKECPHGCGRVFTTENEQGLPIVTFEPAEEER